MKGNYIGNSVEEIQRKTIELEFILLQKNNTCSVYFSNTSSLFFTHSEQLEQILLQITHMTTVCIPLQYLDTFIIYIPTSVHVLCLPTRSSLHDRIDLLVVEWKNIIHARYLTLLTAFTHIVALCQKEVNKHTSLCLRCCYPLKHICVPYAIRNPPDQSHSVH